MQTLTRSKDKYGRQSANTIIGLVLLQSKDSLIETLHSGVFGRGIVTSKQPLGWEWGFK